MRDAAADRRGAEIIDLSLDPKEARREARRRIARVVLPVLAAVALVAAAFGMVAISHLGNRADALRLAGTVLDALEKRIATEVAAWLGPAERVVRLLHGMHAAGAFRGETDLAVSVGTAVLDSVPQVAIVSFADALGNYVMVRRNAEGGTDTKVIETAPRRVVNTVRDRTGAILRVHEDPSDPFDPRTRPWFTGARVGGDVSWTEIYVFFTDRVPGLTVSVAVPAADGRPAAVFGADIRLDALSSFLASLRIGRTGRAMIVDRSGRLVAFPDADRTIRQDGDTLSPVRLDQLEDPVLTRAFDTLRIEGGGSRTMEIGGVRYLTVNTPLDDLVGRDWILMLIVPEEELVGFVGRNSRIALAAGLVVAALALLLAALLVRQGLRADRTQRQAAWRRRALAAQAEAFAAIAGDPALPDPFSPAGTHRLTEAVARTLGARRVSVWRLGASGRI
ncbi:MAG: cache domain-containing protein, partial [Acetobacteraceae bacterium]